MYAKALIDRLPCSLVEMEGKTLNAKLSAVKAEALLD